MDRCLAITMAGILNILITVPATAQQGRVSQTELADARVAPHVIVVYRGTSAHRVYPMHPHGGPPGHLKKMSGGLPPGQVKKLSGARAHNDESEIEFDYLDRERFEQTRIRVRPVKLKKLHWRAPPGHLKARGAKGVKRDKRKARP